MPRVALFGAAPDTMNMGVSALFASTLASLKERIPACEFVVFDGGLGKRTEAFQVSENTNVSCTLFGARAGSRYYRPENLATMSAAASVGPLGSVVNPAVKLIDECDVVLDVSGGDSFSDIYGVKRFLSVLRPKSIALKRGVPLILLPQTYGPYRDPSKRQAASHVAKYATMAWARDTRSFEILKDLLGQSFNPEIHKSGVDLAFGLSPRSAAAMLEGPVKSWITSEDGTAPLAGVNVNGLIFNDPEGARTNYAFKADYERVLIETLTWILENTGFRLVFVPHVMPPKGLPESDYGASLKIIEKLPAEFSHRVAITSRDLDQCQVKWVISKMDWFVGTRMHSTIAGLSSGVPTASVAYSDKTRGVFESCGQGGHVQDPRELDTGDVVRGLIKSFEGRAEAKAILAKEIPKVKRRAMDQMAAIADEIVRVAAMKGASS